MVKAEKDPSLRPGHPCAKCIGTFRTLVKQARNAGNREEALDQVGEGLPAMEGGPNGLQVAKVRVIDRYYPEPKV